MTEKEKDEDKQLVIEYFVRDIITCLMDSDSFKNSLKTEYQVEILEWLISLKNKENN